MVSWVPEILVPTLLALAFFRTLPRRWILLMAPTTWLSDLDYLLPQAWAAALGMPHLHRVVGHTLVLRALIVAGLWWAWWRGPKREGIGFWRYATTPGWPLALLLLAYYLTAHTLMDVFMGGVVLFWPLSSLDLALSFEVIVNTQTGEVIPQAESQVQEGPNQLDPHYEWLSQEHAAMLALVLAVLAGLAGTWLWRRRAGKAAETQDPASSPDPSTKGK